MKHLKNYLAGLTDALASIANWRFGIATLLVLPSMVLVAEPAVALGPCTINWIGADGAWEDAANWSETTTLANRVPNATDTVCIDDASATSVLTITVSSSISVLGIDNAEHLVLNSALLTIEEGGEVVNRGTTTLANGYIVGSAPGQSSVVERFVNHGSLVKSGGNSTYIDSPVRVDNTGTISVTDGQLSIGQVGVWPGITYQVSPAAVLSLGVNGASDISGVQSVSGGGRVAFNGTLVPVSAPLVLNFPDGGLDPLSGVLDTTVAPITNSGVVHFVNPVIKGVGFTNTGTVRQDASSVPTLDEGAVVTNEGSWSMENAYLLGTFGGGFERFVNHGSLVKSGGNSTYIDSPVRVDNTGTISVTDGQLSIGQVGVWPGITYQVSPAAVLSLGVNGASDISGVQSVSGGGRVAFNGTLVPVSAPLVLNFPDGGLDPLSGVLDTTVAPITNSGVVHFVNPVIKGVGFTNTGTVRQDASSVPTLDEGAVVTNEGSWSMENAYLLGTFGGGFERFVNHGSLVKSGGNSTYIDSPVRVDNTGTISVTDGQLSIGQVGVWPGITYQVSPAAVLSLGVNGASDISGVQSVSGGGRVAFNGTLVPVSAPLVLNFPDGGLDPLSGVLDTTVAPITNSGVVHFVNPVIKGVGFTNTGTVRQDASSVPTLDEGAVVTNEGSWSMENAYLLGTFGGGFERFVNHGSLVKSGGNSTYIDSPVRVDNTGTISVTDGQLSILGDVVQVAGGSLVAGTWIATGVLSLPSAGPITTIGASGTVVLDGPAGEFTQLTSLATNRGSFRLSGGRDFTTTGGLTNTGTVRVGSQSTLTVTGDFSTTGNSVFELAGTAATGQFGEIVATGAGGLGGAATIVIDAPYVPSVSDVFRLGTFADITSPFAIVNGAAPAFTANYTATQFVLNGSGSLPIAAAGADVTVAEATPPAVVTLDGSGSTDVDGTITSYNWTAPAGVTLTNANTAVASYAAVDDAAFVATLEVCDNDAQCDTDTVNVTVTNVAPFPNGGADQTATAGTVVPITVTFTDPGTADTHTATVNWSDGSGLIDVGAVASGFGLSHTFPVAGTYFVSICVTDDDGGLGCDTVGVVVASVGNLPPDAVADTGTVRRNSTANFLNVLSNDTDPEFHGLTISVFDAASAAGGAVDCSSQFWCYYTPPVDFVGTDTFTYTASDGQGGVDTATVTVTVVLNQAPVAIDDTQTVRRDSLPRDIYVLGNDSDADFDFLTISAFDPASVAGGTVSCVATGTCWYTPPVGFIGTDTFTYTVSDGRGGTDTATVTVTVVPNTAPDAQDDNYAGNAPDAPFQIFVAGNDFDVDVDVLTVTAVSDPPRGSAAIAADGSHVLYTPDAGVVGTDTFTYTISDGAGGTDTATVTVTVRDYADITNGVVRVGVWDRGNLNIPTGIGLTYVPTGNESTAPGCPCEGWGAADATTGVTGYANESAGTEGIQTVSFVKTASSAVSTVLVGTTLRVTHDYHPSTNPNLYEVTVTVENVSTAPVDVRYRRVMDWDIEPTAFSEYVTIERGNAAGILFTSDDGFASANPLAGPSSLMFTGEAVDSGPSDHGALFDFGFGSLAPGTATTFRTYYGAAGTEVDALAALADVGAEAYSLGQPSTVGGPTLGTPNTFVFAFTGVGGGSAFPEAVPGGPYAVQEGNTVTLDGTGSSVPGGTIASYSWTPASRLTGPTTARPAFTATDDETVPITLTVCDDQTPARCDTKSTTLLVTNAVPVVNAGPDMGATAGTAIAVSTSFTDGGTLDTHSATVNWGDGTAVTTIATATSPFSRSHTYSAAGTFTVTVCVTDDDGGVACDTAVVGVVAANVAPVAVISGPVTVVEGSSIVVSGASSTDSDGTIASYAWSVSAGATLSNTSVQAPMLTGRDDASVTLTLTVTDNNGASHTVSRTVTVTNAVPVVSAGPDLGATAGVAMPLSASFTDAGTLDTHSATIDWGDGSALFDVGAVAAGFSRSHTYAAAGTYTVTACVTDDDGGVGCDTTVAVVVAANVAPVAVISGPVTVVEGSSIVVSGASSTDSDGTIASYAWSVSAGATLSDTSVQAPTLTGVDDASVTLTLTVTDDDGAQHTAARTVTVTNANPVVDAGLDLSGTAGVAVAVSTSFTDAGTLDTHSATVNWGDGTAVVGVGAVVGGFSRSHTYAAAGPYTVTVCVTDDDGGVGCDTAVVGVVAVNVAPVAVISGPVTVVEGSSIVVSGASSTDSDGTIASYAWSVSAGATLSNASVVAPTLTGRDDASVTLTLTVTDNNGASHTTSRTVTVTNASPVVNAGLDLAGTAGVAVPLSATFTDAGTLDTHSATIDWGDGSALFDVGAVAAGFSRSHTYAAAGTFTVTVCVTDDDGGVGCDTTVAVVEAANVAPVAVISGPVTVIEGSSIVVSGATSTDSDGTIASYAWSVTAGATLSNVSVMAPTLTGVDDASVTLTLTVTDDDGAQHTTSRMVTVTNANPVVNAGPDLSGTAGVAVAVSTSFTDAGTLDTHSATVNWGDGTAVLGVGSVVGGFSRSHTYAAAGTFTITACVADDDGGVGCDAAVVTVSAAPVNVAPVAVISGPVTVVEGSSIVVSGASSTDSDGTIASYAWSVSAGATLSNASVVAPTLTGRDDASVTLTLTVTDNNGASHTTSRTVTVTNAVPVVNAGPDVGATAGVAVGVTVGFTDAGTLDTHSATIDSGDGSALSDVGAVAAGFSRSHTYAAAGTYTVTACVIDDDGGVGCDTTVVVVKAPPVAVISGPVTVVEGSSIVVSGATSTDSDGTIASYAWSVTAGATLSNASVQAPTLTGRDDASVTLTLTVTDNDGLTNTTTRMVTVTNANPVVNAGSDLASSIGAAVAVSTSFIDAGTLDSHSATINWGDGTAVTTIAPATSPFSRSHTYTAAGSFTVTVCVTDDDGGIGCDTTVVTVPANVAPVAVISGPVTVVEGSSITVSGTTSTDSDGTIVSYAWSVTAGATLSNASVVAPTLTGRDDATVTLTLTVTDNNGATNTTTRTVTVTNASPVVNAGLDLAGTIGAAVAVSTSFTDAGTLDTHSATMNWGDGSAVTSIAPATSPFSRSHTYTTAGTYTVRVCVTDDNGGVGCDTTIVTISAPLPRLTIGDTAVDEPDSGTRSRTVTVTIAGSNTLPVTVQYRTVNGTAVAGGVAPNADYVPTTGTLTFAPGGGTRTQLITTVVNGDLYAEPDEQFVVELLNVSTNARIDDSTANVTITDDDDICTIVGTSGADVLIGDDGPNVICALAGNDLVDGRGGNDVIFGDAGTDRITFANAPSRVVVDLLAGTATGWGTDQIESFEEVVGSAFDDRLSGTEGANWMVGNSGIDTVIGRGGNDEIFGNDGNDAELNGGLGNDEILGGNGNDRLIGGDGIDTLTGSFGADTLSGNDGNDILEGEDGNDDLVGGDGVDRVYGGVGADTLAGNVGDDTMFGGGDNDTMSGGDGDDTMSGEAGVDTMNGNDGHDTMSGGNDRDVMSGGAVWDAMSGGSGNDTMDGDGGDDRMAGDEGTDNMDGGADQDNMTGGADDDTMFGGTGADTMAGNSGNDTMSGNDGNDSISGGDGNDVLHGNAGNDEVAGGGGNDEVLGDAGSDELHGGSGVNHLYGGAGDDYCSFGPPGETRASCERP